MHVLPFNLNVTCSTSAVTISGRVKRETEIVSKCYQNEYLSIYQIFFFVNIYVVDFRYFHKCECVVHMDATLLIFQMFCPNLLICVHLIHHQDI